MKKNKKTISLANALILPIIGFGIFSLIFSLLVYLFVSKLHYEHELFYQKSIPETSSIVSIFDKLYQIQNNVYKLINEKTQLITLIQVDEIYQELAQLKDLAKKEKTSEIWKQYEKDVFELIVFFERLMMRVEEYVNSKNLLYQKRFQYVQISRYLSELLEENIKNNIEKDMSFFILFQNIIEDFLLLNTDVPMFYGVKVYDRLNANIQELQKNEQNILNSSLRDLYFRIQELVAQQNGITTLFIKLEELRNKETSIIISLDSLANQSMQLSVNIFEKLNNTAKKQNNEIKTMMDYLSYSTIFISIISCILIVVVYKFLLHYILSPFRLLDDYIKKRVDTYSCSTSEYGVSEIRDLTCAVYDFVEQIEENDRKLRESHQNLEELVLQRTEEIRQLSEKIVKLSEEERFKLAAELHDDIGSNIGTIKFGIEHALRLLSESEMKNAREALDGSIKIVKSVANQLRRIQTDLRPPHLDIGLLKTLEWYIEDYKITHPTITINADFFFDELLLSSTLQTVTFRIIQECMNNIAKHSQATLVTIQVIQDVDYKVIIIDNGIGFSSEEQEKNLNSNIGHGIRNIKERVVISGGILHIETAKGKGTKIEATWNL